MIGMAAKNYCIICGKQKNGIEIEEDNVIRALRWIKKGLGKPLNKDRIVVCSACYPQYKTYRKRFVSRERIYIALGIIFLIMGVLASGSILSVLVGIAVVFFLYLLSLLNYTPALKLGSGKGAGGAWHLPSIIKSAPHGREHKQ